MVTSGRVDAETVGRARAWHNGRRAGLCDVVEPWAQGTVMRATRYPSYYDFNLVRVEDDPGAWTRSSRWPIGRSRGSRTGVWSSISLTSRSRSGPA